MTYFFISLSNIMSIYSFYFIKKNYICTKEIGWSKAFHDDFNIKNIFHVTRVNSDHSHHSYMNAELRQWWTTNFIYVTLQMMSTEGNICLFCNNGRSRSPMYLVAYLVVVHSLFPSDAMDIVRCKLWDVRGEQLDRYDSLGVIIEDIYSLLRMT